MKVVILAGGLGSRISEESIVRPKPMVEIGGMPIIWHIMKIYSTYGFNDFIICLGYKGHMLMEYFTQYQLHHSDITVDLQHKKISYHVTDVEPWQVTLVHTGDTTETGGRLKHIAPYLGGDAHFCLTYGDGVADINIAKLIEFHKAHGKQATITAVTPPARFGALSIKQDKVIEFIEKPKTDGGLINGGFFVLSTKVLDLIDSENTLWEKGPLETLAAQGQLMAYIHKGFWQPMDTLRDKNYLEKLWASGNAPWKIWDKL